jgi:hypothetical protein
MNYVCHSGGCTGADMAWETAGEEYGVKTIAYSFPGHTQYGKNQKVLTPAELTEGFEAVMRANKTLKKYPQGQPTYVKNLLARNWFQVKNSEAIFAVGKLRDNLTVEGGTGWAVQMAVDCDKPVFLFFQDDMGGGWFRYKPITGFESMGGEIPKLTENFAGIGTRKLNNYGLQAICDVYDKIFGVEEEQQTRFPVTEQIAGAAPVNPAIL